MRIATLSLALFLMLFRAKAEHVSETFEGKHNKLKVLTIIDEARFGPKDVWDERQTPTTVSIEAIVQVAKSCLARASASAEKAFHLDSISLKRFGHTQFWFFVVNLADNTSEVGEIVPVIIKLDGTPVEFAPAEKKARSR